MRQLKEERARSRSSLSPPLWSLRLQYGPSRSCKARSLSKQPKSRLCRSGSRRGLPPRSARSRLKNIIARHRRRQRSVPDERRGLRRAAHTERETPTSARGARRVPTTAGRQRQARGRWRPPRAMRRFRTIRARSFASSGTPFVIRMRPAAGGCAVWRKLGSWYRPAAASAASIWSRVQGRPSLTRPPWKRSGAQHRSLPYRPKRGGRAGLSPCRSPSSDSTAPIAVRALPVFQNRKCSISLFLRNSGRKTALHFAGIA